MTKIAFLGSGNMASAMVDGILAQKLASAAELSCLGGSGGTAQALADRTGIRLAGSADQLLEGADALVVAFKPHHLTHLDKRLARICDGRLVLSVLAGKRLHSLWQAFPHARAIVRCMPNTPSRIGAGITGWCTDKPLGAADRVLVERLLGALGKTIEIPEENMDALTAVSGSGPAYVFEFIAALREAGTAAGLGAGVAETLALETVLGAAKLLEHRKIAPETLRDEVTSPNGVTFAALNRLKAGDFRTLIKETVAAGKARAHELSKDA